MIRRTPISTRSDTLFPSRRSSDLVSGINGVAWDAVELPSQFMENWCWEPEDLALISGHYETGEPLPQDLLEKMLAAKNFQRSEAHKSELQSLMRNSSDVFCLKKKTTTTTKSKTHNTIHHRD